MSDKKQLRDSGIKSGWVYGWSGTTHEDRSNGEPVQLQTVMAQLQLPFTLSSHPAVSPIDPDTDTRKTAPPHPLSFSTSPVLRLSASQRTSKQPLHVVVTVPGQGWSIHKVSDQTILSSQKVSPNLAFTTPCVALSIPQTEQAAQKSDPTSKSSSKKNKKTRTRYIYAAVASCPSDPSPAVNQGRTVWVWIENEVNGGFGERDTSNANPSKSSSANIIKEFPSRVEMVYPLPSIRPEDSSETQLARILVLLESGEALLCSQDLTTIATCRVHSNPPPSTPIDAPYVRVQTHSNDQQDNTTSNLIRHPGISTANSLGLLIYISRLKPEFHSSSEHLPNKSTPKGRASKKRKSVSTTQSSKPTSAGLTHYSHLEICVLELQSDKLLTLGGTSHKQDFLDVAIGAQGWVTIMGRSHTLSTYLLSRSPSRFLEADIIMPSGELALIQHPQCNPIQLTTNPQSVETTPISNTSTPVIVPLPCSVPLVFIFLSHSTSTATVTSTTCLGLIVDLYHQAVLCVLQCPWPTAPKHTPASPPDHGPLTLSATLSSSSQSSHVYLCLSYQSIRIVQVLQAPVFPPDAPTWVEVLNPVVTDATLSWIIPKSNHADVQAKTALNRQKIPLLSEQLLGCCTMSFSSKACPEEASHLSSLKSFISRFNDICLGTTCTSGHWDAETSKAAETAWVECVLNLFSGQDASESQDVDMEGNDLSTHAQDQLVTTFLRGSHSVSKKLSSILPKAFVHDLLGTCLGQFAAHAGKESTAIITDERTLSSETQPSKSKPYPAQIVICLLNSGLVEEGMVAGGVVAALRRTADVVAVEASISRLYDVDEFELVETIRWAVQLQASQPIPAKANGRKLSLLERLLSNIISQPLSLGPLKKALRQTLSTNDILIIFRILNEWIDWWMKEGMEILHIHPTSLDSNSKPTGESSGSTGAPLRPENKKESDYEAKAHSNGLPDLAPIFEFVECSLDAHLIGLIQYKEASVVLEALKLKLTWEIEMDTVLQGLSGPLAQSSQLIKQKQRRQREKLTQSHKQPLSKGQNPKPNGTNSKPSKPLHHRSSAHTAQPNGRPASNRPSKKSTPKRSVHPDARRLQAETSNAQSVAEYALERFNL
ncbi:hypothetical protein PCANC_00922 [Puccinia coronata f. sp. avenae]|uniref:Uncharacterized protein n=2 Tax=Puccinia coronata f. sp. avenae TaxID=200324 RepID=A0A2N5W6F1_9BASI|nr:hypothetical protein PCANC_00922 [Puccinia coronata f. sp. avenae]